MPLFDERDCSGRSSSRDITLARYTKTQSLSDDRILPLAAMSITLSLLLSAVPDGLSDGVLPRPVPSRKLPRRFSLKVSSDVGLSKPLALDPGRVLFVDKKGTSRLPRLRTW
jgi:hypothetical protein